MASSRIFNANPLAALFWFLALAAVAACAERNSSSDGDQSPAIPVRVLRVEREDLKETVFTVGSLAASEDVTIRPEISGIVSAIHFSEGKAVEQGNLLFSLEDDDIRQRLEARRAALKAAAAETENARRMLERREKLLANEIIARETFDEVQTEYETAEARRRRLKAEIREIRAELRDTKIRSPIDGITGAHRIDSGDFVETGDPLVTIVRTDILEIDFTVAERYANRVRVGQSVAIRTAAAPERAFEGAVFFVSPSVRENTRDLLLKARIDNPQRRLRPGGFAHVDLILQERPQALVLPEEALVPTRSGYIVFVVEDRHARRREVTIGLRRPGTVEIRTGLEAGETVIRSGQMAVSDGDRVQVLE
jgi:membrane fusion protein (multidrug efflux system)